MYYQIIRDLMFYFVMILLTLLSCVLVALAAHETQHERDLHDKMYSQWFRPDYRLKDGSRNPTMPCCGGGEQGDCYPTKFRKAPILDKDQSGWEFLVRETGQWAPVPAKLLEQNQPDPVESVDEEGHVCERVFPDGVMVFCVTLPQPEF